MIRQFIEIRGPVHTACNQLMQFEDYPRFMEDVETVRLFSRIFRSFMTAWVRRHGFGERSIDERQRLPDALMTAGWRAR